MEQITVKDHRLYALIAMYDMHTDYFLKAIDGISDSDTHNRLGTKANHIAWLAGSLVEGRYVIAKGMGIDCQSSSFDLFRDHKGIQDDATYPSLDVYRKDWERVSPLLRGALTEVSAERMDETMEMGQGYRMPYFDLTVFALYREANCIGQIILWRRLLGYDPINYM